MPEQVNIVCPHCRFTKTIALESIPAGVTTVTCPKCKQSFPLTGNSTPMPAAPLMAEMVPPASPPAGPEPGTGVPTAGENHAPRALRFAFNGSARDYFGIWIVNTLLKVLTAGFYSAWAKVRKRRFFYGSTTLHGHAFEYLADPWALFKGWLVAAAAFVLYGIGSRVSPLLSSVIGLLIFLAFPWLLVRSRIFNATNSSYRNIRFGFRRVYKEAYTVYAGLMILSVLTLGLLVPYMLYRQKKFIVENSSYGTTPFTFTATAKDFYHLSLKIGLGFAAIVGLVGLTAWTASQGIASSTRPIWALIPLFALPPVYFLLGVYARTALANLSWNSTRLGEGHFCSSLSTKGMALLFITNALGILFSLGLLMPWATVRLTRYRFEHLELVTTNGLDDVLAEAGSASVGATGEEIGDLFDMPIEIAL